MVDQDTDRWVFEVLAPKLRRNLDELELEGQVQWTDLMYGFQSLHESASNYVPQGAEIS